MPNEAKLLYDALLYENGHLRRTQHILKVYGLAKMLGELENLPTHEQENLRAAAILHDIAIRFCKEKYGNGCPANQRKEAPTLVRKFLTACGYKEEDFPRITKMVVLHHCYDKIDGKDLQLLVEADLIAGCTEEEVPSAHAKAVRRLFKSASGLALLDTFIKE